MPAGTVAGAGGAPAARPATPPGEAHDPYKPFVTAGQISGPKTPPPARQQELWNTVFGENYEAIGEEQEDAAGGRRAWLPALVASAGVALLAGLLWAFLAGPLRPSTGGDGGQEAAGTPKASASASGRAGATRPKVLARLPKYRGTASPVAGTVTDPAAGVSVPRLGAPWRLDQRGAQVRTSFGLTTRQYVAAGTDATGRPRYAQLMTGPLPEKLAGKYSADKPADLAPTLSSVAYWARFKFFPAGNTVVKKAEQNLTSGGRPARVVVYEVVAGDTRTTLVVGAVSTGGARPAIVYMSVPDTRKALLPDVNTVFAAVRPAAAG
ncbi:hypothetical protein [Sphaerisporangium rufum]|uniref:hypothetical protein n=1 Tax=Sphaerisporangium rufum TaxID=1381558 RepID=UPI00195161B5|nr:hypothetical protein [Sphaerisporangium rufum]